MKKIRSLVLILVLFLCFNGCEKNPSENQSPENIDELSVEQAKAFVDSQHIDQFTLKAGNIQKQTIAIRGDWTKAKSNNNGKVSVVETEIQAMGRLGFATSESMDAWNATKNDAYLCSMSRLVVMKEKKTGEMNSFIMTFVADKPYFESKKFKLSDNTYLKRDKDLSGYILYHNLSGKFVNGWVYCDGQIINSIKEANTLDLPVQLKSVEMAVAVYQWVETCTDWYSITENSFSYTGTYCSTKLVYLGTYESGTETSGGNGVAGGYITPPTCNCTEKCTFCKKCIRVDLKSASVPGEGGTTTNDPCEYCTCPPVPMPNIDIDGYDDLTDAEKSLVRIYPLEAARISLNRDMAIEKTIEKFGINGHNDKSDAFRHAYFQALNVLNIGYQITKKFADAHEERPDQPEIEKSMDLYNNSIGMDIGRNNYNIYEVVNNALATGKLMYIKNGQIVPTNQ